MNNINDIIYQNINKQNIIDRFCRHIITPNWINNSNICWVMNYTKTKDGYYIFTINNKIILAHRISYSLFNKIDIVNGMVIRHTCNNPSCVNPYHLKIGTQKDNLYDMIISGNSTKNIQYGSYAKNKLSKKRKIRNI